MLLGLNLKFCISANTLPNDIKQTMLKMARSIRIRYFLLDNSTAANPNYEKQIYVKNDKWHPPPAPISVEDKITDFEKGLRRQEQALITKNKKLKLSNLTPLQTGILRQLKENKNIIIKPSDKNLGPTVMDTTSYVKQVLEEHLLSKDYKQLTKEEVQNSMENLKLTLKTVIENNSPHLSEPELNYFKRSLARKFRIPIFYGLPKVHKTPFSLRPVVSTTNSLLAIASTWLDYKMKTLLPYVQSYIKNSMSVIQDLKQLQIPNNALLFSADAVSMYTNIDTQQAILSMHNFIYDNTDNIPSDFPTALFLQLLEIVMTNNIFSFDNTYWLQLTGTAMGTPAACSYATITYGQHENARIFPRFGQRLLYYKRYIDDIFGIWIPSETDDHTIWEQFKTELNNWASLRWKIENRSNKTVFLDLNINLINTKIHTSTFQKDLNLYLYIPPLSAHPPSCLKGLIAGEIRRYWLQNEPEDFLQILSKFIERLLNRGHRLENLTPIINQVARSLDNQLTRTSHNSPADIDQENTTLFIHKTYHPNGLQSHHIRGIYDNILKPHLPFEKMTVAISRPTNLRDLLTSAKLKKPMHLNVQDLINTLERESQQNPI